MDPDAAARKAKKLAESAAEKRRKIQNHDALLAKAEELERQVRQLHLKLDAITDAAALHVRMHMETVTAANDVAVQVLPGDLIPQFTELLQNERMRIRDCHAEIPDDTENGKVLFTFDPHGKLSIEAHINSIHEAIDRAGDDASKLSGPQGI